MLKRRIDASLGQRAVRVEIPARLERTSDQAVAETCPSSTSSRFYCVEPGTFSSDIEAGQKSLAQLKSLAARHPKMEVRLGHQR